MTTALTFLGGVGTVTGSKTAVEADGSVFLVDCGLFQGPRDIRSMNWEPFPIDPTTLTSIVLTHAHLDHCGYIPALVRDGFDGPIFCTPNTAALTEIILRDSAKLQEEDAAFARKKGFSRHVPPLPLYESADVEKSIDQFVTVEFGDDISPAPGVTARFDPAGHILGSAIATITSADGKRIIFSGDLGRPDHPLLKSPAYPGSADAIVIESTYGDREHLLVDSALEILADAITRTIKRGGTVLIPAFAVDRTEILLKSLHDLQNQQRIPRVPVHVDSPMALAAFRVYREAIASGDAEIRSSIVATGIEAIHLPNVSEATTPEHSMALDRGGAQIVISASGMATGGRVVHHLKALLPDRDNAVVLVGYQGVGTPGRALLDGAEEVKLHGKYVRVRAEIVNATEFSVHADASELLDWLSRAETPPSQVFVNHGEPDAEHEFARRIIHDLDLPAVVPALGERVLV